ncbi:hypothetical protein SO802_025721 [Lithocarpus litseifolius]|uniref:Endonuclease/exonuclease/phosphatase domain-containing protein n=1 Tax=Lithocarpus litseifolius TaxID=425828 RepID=A0AAW2BXL4_9ROSI
METKSNKDWMVMVHNKCEFKHGLFVSSNGMSGGLALMWKEDVKVEVQTFPPSHIDALVDGGTEYVWWRVTDFYGNPETTKRPEAWAKLKQLSTTSTPPWLVIGDFNEITGMSEKEGGSARPRQQMSNFVNTINYCGLRDIGFVGPKYTWWYVRRDGEQIRERLDKALATTKWLNLFPEAKLHHLTSSASDHSLLLLKLVQRSRRRPKKLFRFESIWLKDPRCEEVVMEAWNDGLADQIDFPLVSCSERCRLKLEAWNKIEFGHVGNKISELQKHLEWLEMQSATPYNVQDMKATQVELNCWNEKQDAMWLQRLRINSYQAGDWNTGFFHAKASARKLKNHIEGLLDENDC